MTDRKSETRGMTGGARPQKVDVSKVPNPKKGVAGAKPQTEKPKPAKPPKGGSGMSPRPDGSK